MTAKKLRIVVLIAIVILSVAGDQLTKYIARETLKGQGTIQVLGDILVLHYTENQGAFLGLGSKWPDGLRTAVFGFLSLTVVLGIGFVALRGKNMLLPDTVAMAFVIGGGIGNLVDRLFRGGLVSDFMNIGIGRVRTGVFNVADLFLVAGVIMFVVLHFRRSSQAP